MNQSRSDKTKTKVESRRREQHPRGLTQQEIEFWEYKRHFLIKELGFPKKEADQGALIAVQAFRTA